jgi:hypothetical protein
VGPWSTAVAALACALAGAWLGLHCGTRLPPRLRDEDTRSVVKVTTGLIATLTALVLGLVTASAKGGFDKQDAAVKHGATDLLALDRLLDRYGPDALPVREHLRRIVAQRVDEAWHPDGPAPGLDGLEATRAGEQLEDLIRALAPQTDVQRELQARALALSIDLLQTRWSVIAGRGSSIPPLFLVVLSLWLALIFAGFALYAPRNGVVRAALVSGAVAAASAVYLIVELDSAFEGALRVSDAPLRFVLSRLGA